jgi:hypothetical protein
MLLGSDAAVGAKPKLKSPVCQLLYLQRESPKRSWIIMLFIYAWKRLTANCGSTTLSLQSAKGIVFITPFTDAYTDLLAYSDRLLLPQPMTLMVAGQTLVKSDTAKSLRMNASGLSIVP